MTMVKVRKTKYTLILGGGAHLGAIQAGQIMALCEAGIEVERIIGCSVGALNGSAIATGMDTSRGEWLMQTWKTAGSLAIFDRGVRRLMNIASKKPGISRNEQLWNLARSAAAAERLENYPIPTEIVTCNLTRGEVVYHTEGEAAEIIVASCSMPGVYPPVRIGEDLHVDGGVLDVLPWRRSDGKESIVLDCRGGSRPTRMGDGALGILLASFALARHHRVYDGMGEAGHLHTCPGPEHRVGLTLRDGESLANEAYEIAKKWIDSGGLAQADTRGRWARLLKLRRVGP